MSHHDNIAELISQGRLEIIYVHGTRRSGSTITEIIFGQQCHCARDQPFRKATFEALALEERQDRFSEEHYESACAVIENDVTDVLKTQDRARLLVKEVSGVMPAHLFRRWAALPSRFIVTFRDPYAQFVSLARAMHAENESAKTLPDTAVFLRDILPVIEDAQLKGRGGMTLLEFLKANWSSLPDEVESIRMTGRPTALIETTLMRFNPLAVLQAAADKLGLFAPGTEGIFEDGSKKVRYGREGRSETPFIRRAATSTRIDPLSLEEKIHPASLTKKTLELVAEIEPIYLDLLKAPENTFLPERKQVLHEVCHGTESDLLIDMQPYLAQTIIGVREELAARADAASSAYS